MAKLVPKTQEQPEEAEFMPKVLCAAEAASDVKATDIVAYDVRGLTLIADCFVVCTANSEPQMRAVCTRIQDRLRETGSKPLHVEGESDSGWIVMDYGSVIVHVFKKQARGFYDLDGLWGDAPRFDLNLD